MRLFIITSVLVTSSVPLSYTKKRSLYSIEERYEQTLKTKKSIETYSPGSMILLVEGSTNLPPFLRKRLQSEFSHVLITSDLPRNSHYVDNVYKGIGELWLMKNGVEHALQHFPECDSLFKISGRYCLNAQHDPENFIVPKNIFYPVESGSMFDEKVPCVYTFLFKIHRHYWPSFLTICNRGLTEETRLSMERFWFVNMLPNTHLIREPLGIEGKVSVTRAHISK
jgi:hypothetical protein